MKIKLFCALFLIPCSLLLYSFSEPVHKRDNDEPFVVVLDAGHGGHDPGNLGNGYLEKKIALNIVLKVGELLGQHKDIKVIYTRKDDTFIDLYVRGEVANKANADLFVSVHCDSHTSDAHGAGTFVLGLHANKQNFEIAKKENSVIYLEDNYENRYADYDINSPESVIGLTIMQEEFLDQSVALATLIQENFSKSLKRTDRKVKQAGFIVLHQTFMPSVLVETGFLTNREEGSYLDSNKGQAEMGSAIAKAILKYKESFQPSSQPSKTTVVTPAAGTDPSPKGEIAENTNISIEKAKEPVAVQAKKVEEAKQSVPVGIASSAEKVTETDKVAEGAGKSVSNPEEAANPITFKVQLMASSKDIALDATHFKGLGSLSREPVKSLYRYMYGETRSYREAEMMQAQAAEKGYPTAYIVAYRSGERIPLKIALKEVSQ